MTSCITFLEVQRDLLFVARHEDVADAIFASLRQGDAPFGHFLAEEAIVNLHENIRAVAHQRVGADSAGVRQVLENEETVLTIWCDSDPSYARRNRRRRHHVRCSGQRVRFHLDQANLRIGHRAHVCGRELVDVSDGVLRHRFALLSEPATVRGGSSSRTALILGSAHDSAVALSKIRRRRPDYPEGRAFPGQSVVARACHGSVRETSSAPGEL